MAAKAGVPIEPTGLEKHDDQHLVEAADATAIHKFDYCVWDAGELLGTMKNWQP